MKAPDKETLLTTLCNGFPYGLIINCCGITAEKLFAIEKKDDGKVIINHDYDLMEVRPYLRELSQLIEEEHKELSDIIKSVAKESYPNNDIWNISIVQNWCDKHHVDYQGLLIVEMASHVTKENNPYDN